jgi:predicted glycosyltransferase
MRFLIEILHPAHVHFFRPFVEVMAARGHEFLILSRDKDVTVELLDAHRIPHTVLSRQSSGKLRLLAELLLRVWRGFRLGRRFKPDYAIGLMGPTVTIVGRLLGARTVVFYDNETTALLNGLVARACDAWWSPRGYRLDHGGKHYRYDGYHELAYLHPERFTPDPEVVRRAGLDPDAPYFVVRFVAWEAIHDVNEFGFSLQDKYEIVQRLESYGRVLITSERPLPPDFEPYRLNLPPAEVHHVLAFATLLVGESSTMASEAACLGTKALFVSRSGRGVNDEQEARYGLVRTFHGEEVTAAADYLGKLLAAGDQKTAARESRERLLSENIDVTGFLVSYFTSGCADTSRSRRKEADRQEPGADRAAPASLPRQG